MAEVASKLKRPDAAVALDLALTFAAQMTEKTRRESAADWGRQTARISPAALESLLQDLEVVAQFNALGGAVRGLARSGDLELAQLSLKKMEDLMATPEIKAADQAEREPGRQKFDSGRSLARARLEVATALAPQDAGAALKIADDIRSASDITAQLDALLKIGAAAHRAGKNGVAATALRTVAGAEFNADYGARAGAIAMSFDPKLGAELFQTALERATPSDENRRYQPSVATWAFEEAPFDAALARAVLEREWSWRLPAYQAAEAAKKTANEYNPHQSNLGYLAWAMSAFDRRRALDWAEILPEKSYERGQAKALIAVTLLATPEQRLNFNRYLVYEAPES